MKKIVTVICLIAATPTVGLTVAATLCGKKEEPCAGISGIQECPVDGCSNDGKLAERKKKLNQLKNKRMTEVGTPTLHTIEWMRNRPNPKHCWDREELRTLGEGDMVKVVAWALAARCGSQESCNCYLFEPQDTDNHIVLVEPSLKKPTLTRSEKHSITAEFTPRVRLDHPNFTQEKFESLIDPDWQVGEKPTKGKLLVRVTGPLFFDSGHYCDKPPLTRENDWEIHPVLKMEYCPEGKTCRADSDENWKDLDNESTP